MSWDELFSAMAPCMIREAAEYSMLGSLRDTIIKKMKLSLRENHDLEVNSVDFHKITVQLRALGLIAPSEQKRSVKDRGTMYWSLTPFGDEYMNRLLAIPRSL